MKRGGARGRGIKRLPASLPSACLTCPNSRTGFCSQLARPDLARLAHRSARVAIKAGGLLPAPASGSDFYILISGYMGSVHHGADGKRRISSLTMPGEGFAVCRTDLQSEVEALTDAEVCRIHGVSHREALSDNPDFRRLLFLQVRAQLDRIQRFVLKLGSLSTEQRLAGFLIKCQRFMPWQPLPGGGGVLTMELGRADIAALLGTTEESLSRITHRLQREGLIRIRDPRQFEIPDLGRLIERSTLDPRHHFPSAPLPRRGAA